MKTVRTRILSILLALLMLTSLAACGGTGSSESPASDASAPPPQESPVSDASTSPLQEAPAETAPAETDTHVIEGSGDVTLRLTWSGDGQNKALLDECIKTFTE